MSSIVIAGDTSGSVTLQAPAVAGSTVLNLPSTSGTIQASGAGYTTNGVAYATSATGLATGSALTFDGTNFATTGKLFSASVGVGTNLYAGIGMSGGGDNVFWRAYATHIWQNATDPSTATTGTELMRLTSTGLGIKTSTPITPLTVQANSGGDATSLIGRSTGQNEAWLLWYKNGGSVTNAGILGDNQGLKFGIGSGLTEAARFDSSGNLLVGTTTASGKLFSSTSSASQPALRAASTSATYNDNVFAIDVDRNTTNNTFYAISYYNNGAAAHKFRVADSGNVTNTNNSYGAISDVKLKENIVDATPKLSALQNVRIVNYNRIGSEEKELGVIAQELEQVFPALVETHIDRDAENNDLGTTTKSVKYSVFVPMLIKAIQEQQALITTLTDRISVLENK